VAHLVRAGRLGIILAACYLALAALTIAYELGVRIFDRGNSEFAGMLSIVMTLPTGVVLNSVSRTVLGVRAGDSDTSFVVILGLAALVNGAAMYFVVRLLTTARK
jgi:hypothetical protein